MSRIRDLKGRFLPNPVQNGNGKPIHNQRMVMSAVENAMSLRRKIWEQLLDSRRDIDDECGYPATEELSIRYYRRLYDREPIANRVVNLLPDESWAVNPRIFEDSDPGTTTRFEEDFLELGKSLRGNTWHESNEGHPLWEYCHRIDGLSGIGQFGVLLLGTDHEGELSDPVELNVEGGKKTNNLTFIRCFDESLVGVAERNKDVRDSRFGQPEFYHLSFESVDQTGIIADPDRKITDRKTVHWTRIIHVADTIESNEIFAIPRIRPNYNRLYDIRKLLGGSAEMYWRGALPPIFLETHPDLGADVEITDSSKDTFEQLMNTLQRWAFIPGVTAKQLAPTVVDPSKQIEVQIDAICIQIGCPKRVFMGSERGELASSQDSKTWNNRVNARHNRYLIPRLIVPLIDRLIQMQILTTPESYSVEFPDLNSLTELEKVELGRLKTESLVKYIQGGGENLISELDYLIKYQGMEEEEAQEVLSRTVESLEETEEQNFPLENKVRRAIYVMVVTALTAIQEGRIDDATQALEDLVESSGSEELILAVLGRASEE